MKAVILARVSTVKQEKEGLSLKDIQLPQLKDYADKMGFEVVKEFVFQESADRKIRKKFNEMIEFVRKNDEVKAIITFRVDRITRNFRDAVLIDELRLDYDKEIHFVYNRLVINKKSMGRDMQDWDLQVFLAKQYLNRLKEDAVNSAMFKLKNGEWPVKAPYGYRNITLESNKKWVEVDPIEAEVVVKMYEWYSTGSYSLLEIRNKVKEVFNLDFSKGYVDFILKNKFYEGIMVFSGQEFPHVYERIVSQDIFDRVQEIKASFNKKHFKFAGLPYLYRGLIRCEKCGCIVTPEKKKGQYVYYHCTQYNGKHGAEWIREEKLTKQFARRFSELEMPDEVVDDIVDSLRKAHKNKSHFHNSLLSRYNDEYERYEKRIEKMYDDKLDGSITEDYYNKKLKEYRAKQKAIQKKQAKLHFADEGYYITSDYILQLASRASELFESSEPHEKRLLLKMTLQNFKLRGKKVDSDWLKPFDKVSYYASRQEWLALVDYVGTYYSEQMLQFHQI